MPDYKQMYHILFNKITDIVDGLQAVQQQAEEMYINSEEQIVELSLAENKKEDSISTILPK